MIGPPVSLHMLDWPIGVVSLLRHLAYLGRPDPRFAVQPARADTRFALPWKRADLRYADLDGADLRFADLGGADLSGVDLSGADLRGAYLLGATMPDGRRWEDYITDPLAGICDEPEARARAVAAWGNHSWTDCPLHAAHGWTSVRDAPANMRCDVAAFVVLFDARLLPRPGEPPCH